MAWIKWKLGEVIGRIHWELGEVSFDELFFFRSTRRMKELFVSYSISLVRSAFIRAKSRYPLSSTRLYLLPPNHQPARNILAVYTLRGRPMCVGIRIHPEGDRLNRPVDSECKRSSRIPQCKE